MRLDTILLASLPTAALAAELQYTPPTQLMNKVSVESTDGCVFPATYKIQDFTAKSNDTKSTLAAFDFKYTDPDTQVGTACHFNSSSKSTTPGGLTSRYACENGEIKFIWQNEYKRLTMVERICPGSDGKADYEVAGSAVIPVKCKSRGECSTNATSYGTNFTSINPVTDPTHRM